MNDRRDESPIGREFPDEKINQSHGEEIALKNQFLIDISRRIKEKSNGRGKPPCSEEILLAIKFLTERYN